MALILLSTDQSAFVIGGVGAVLCPDEATYGAQV